jgi:hypothetical protein
MAKRDLTALVGKAGQDGEGVTQSRSHKVTTSRPTKNSQANRETYYIPKELHNELKIRAITDGGSPSDLVVSAIEKYLGKTKKKAS